jgi:serine/threonine-protein kinase SBK
MFASEYAPMGDLTSNISSDRGIGETCAKLVTRQIGSALEWVHSKNLCHLDVKLDNILVFRYIMMVEKFVKMSKETFFVHLKSKRALTDPLAIVFRSDFSWVKLCDFGSVRSQGDIVIKKNELLPYCPSELVAKHSNEYYQVRKMWNF